LARIHYFDAGVHYIEITALRDVACRLQHSI